MSNDQCLKNDQGPRTRHTPEHQRRLVNLWNRENPIGTPVSVLLDDGRIVHTKTSSEAQLLCGDTAVIWFIGIAGCYSLARVAKRVEVDS